MNIPDKKFGVPVAGIAAFAIVVGLWIVYDAMPETLAQGFGLLGKFWPLWVVPLTGYVFWKLWVIYRRMHFIEDQKLAMLEIRIPREIRKTPLAMEAVFAGLNITIGETTFIDRNFLGKARTWFSFELVSIDGNVHFFIWTRDFYKELVKAQIYAQYPEVEVHEVEDYTKFIPFDLDKYGYFGCDFVLGRPDPYPIKTYIEYGLDKEGSKEEEKTDPLTSVLELLGSLPKGHQLWLQILVQGHRGPRRPWPWSERQGVDKEAREVIEGIVKNASERSSRILKNIDADEGTRVPSVLTEGEREVVRAMERNVGKLNFDVGMRGLYLAEKDKFHPIYLVGMLGVMKQFNSTNFNRFDTVRGLTGFDFPWQDFRGIMQNRRRRKTYEAYRLRSWFHPPYKNKSYVLSTEELATIYHFPGEVLKTPTAPRITSRRAEAPSNLPT